MKPNKLSIFMRKGLLKVEKHSPEILMVLGIGGMITTTVTAVKATPKALELVKEAELDKGGVYDETGEIAPEPLTPIEAVKVAWKCYIPSVLVGGLSVACLIGANSAHLKRHAAIAAAYAISESTLKEYQDKVIQTIGEKKAGVIKDEIAKDRIKKDPVANHEVLLTERGNTLCYDALSGRYFKSDIDRIKKAENNINRQMRYDMYVTLNEFYSELGLESIKIGDELGWCIDNGYLELDFRSQLTDDGTPCLVIDYRVGPKYDYKY